MNTGRLDRDSYEKCGDGHFLTKRWFSWSAIIAGALVGIGISFLLNLFNVAIGVTAFRMTSTAELTTATNLASTPTLVVGGYLALIFCAIVSMGALGWVAGYIGGLKCISCKDGSHRNCNYGCLYGFISWCLALVLTIFISAHVGKFVSYSMVALTQPTVAVGNYTYENSQRSVTTKQAPQNQMTTVNEEAAAKTLALTAFAAFSLFFIGAISASFFGHIGFARCLRKHS